jgi:hypothetical protein
MEFSNLFDRAFFKMLTNITPASKKVSSVTATNLGYFEDIADFMRDAPFENE